MSAEAQINLTSNHGVPEPSSDDGTDTSTDSFGPLLKKRRSLIFALQSPNDETLSTESNHDNLLNAPQSSESTRSTQPNERKILFSGEKQPSSRGGLRPCLAGRVASADAAHTVKRADKKWRVSSEDTARLVVPGPSILRRSSSNSRLERRPQSSKPVSPNRKRAGGRIVKTTRKPWRLLRNNPIVGSSQKSPGEAFGGVSFKWFPARANSFPSTPKKQSVTTRGHDIPLKPCMKQKSKSASTTPPEQRTEELQGSKATGKIKTVGFDMTDADPVDLFTFFKLQNRSIHGNKATNERLKGNSPHIESSATSEHRGMLPGVMSSQATDGKGKPADAAMTRTDVHVVSIVPLRLYDNIEDAGSPTPTMQVVESDNGTYEVVWDDMPLIDDRRVGLPGAKTLSRLNATASLTSGARGLDQVNSKLEWWWKNSNPHAISTPRIVVFPDEDEGYFAELEHETRERTISLPVPPNSTTTSKDVSRHNSHPPSMRPSRNSSTRATGSSSESEDEPTSRAQHDQSPSNVASKIGAYDKMTFPLGIGSDAEHPLADRRLSNMEDSEIKFRGHRDSMALARLRVFNAGGVSPELFMHRDSVALAKKRMQMKKHHAIPASRSNPPSSIEFSEPLPLAQRANTSKLTPPSIQAVIIEEED
ncbi:hypothetical protein BU24DRAFT_489603 [Aaosphaeria arxii CBS 175.79]|uniref:Uncharacterized protein n=1 Tax=Aaosphaeria arxii CBS 175.79 TaxID=1450172 RepID=A0A6A5Y2B4_9PLEO|nr:uncharacterized protein BU24DRAFT_489603 [Aaosphaeria arxii CBS 175.79]KAF2019695.1 hypothetical protein BU24DRAFT_489603 [Aaosphaeria arxii CBS 175.79]